MWYVPHYHFQNEVYGHIRMHLDLARCLYTWPEYYHLDQWLVDYWFCPNSLVAICSTHSLFKGFTKPKPVQGTHFGQMFDCYINIGEPFPEQVQTFRDTYNMKHQLREAQRASGGPPKGYGKSSRSSNGASSSGG